MEGTLAIEVTDLVVGRGGKRVLQQASLKAERGQVVALLGASAAGKTTLLRTIAGFERAQQGTVHVLGQNMAGCGPEGRPVSMLFQDPVLFPGLTVRQNALVGLPKATRAVSEARMTELANAFHVSDFLDRRVDSNLSGGERQRAALLRVFVAPRDILLLDEPLKSALNADLRWSLMGAMASLMRAGRFTTVLVTHDFEEAAFFADSLAVLVDGRIEQGSPEELFSRPRTIRMAQLLGRGAELPAEVVLDRLTSDALFPGQDVRPSSPRLQDAHSVYVRPTAVRIEPRGAEFRVASVRFMGSYNLVALQGEPATGASGIVLFGETVTEATPQLNARVGVSLDKSKLLLFDTTGELIA